MLPTWSQSGPTIAQKGGKRNPGAPELKADGHAPLKRADALLPPGCAQIGTWRTPGFLGTDSDLLDCLGLDRTLLEWLRLSWTVVEWLQLTFPLFKICSFFSSETADVAFLLYASSASIACLNWTRFSLLWAPLLVLLGPIWEPHGL